MGHKFGYTEEEMRELILRNYSRMVAYIRRLLGHQIVVCEAEDLFHDSICQFLEKRAEIEAAKVDAYLFRIVRNRTLNHITRNHTDRLHVTHSNEALSAWDTLASLDYEGDNSSNTQTIDLLDINEIIQYSESFSPRMRRIFYMSRIEGLTHQEIAEQLGISIRSVERDLQHSVTEFRRFFGYNKNGAS